MIRDLKNKQGEKYAQNLCNNTYDIVKQENLIETIDDNIKDIEKEKKNTITSKGLNIFVNLLCLFLIVGMPILIFKFYSSEFLFPVKTGCFADICMRNILNFLHITNISLQTYYALCYTFANSIVLCIPFGVIGMLVKNITYKRSKKKVAGFDKALEYLKARKLNEEETLAKLKEETKELPIKEQENDYKHIEVDEDYLDELNNNIDDAFNKGYTLSLKKKNLPRITNIH